MQNKINIDNTKYLKSLSRFIEDEYRIKPISIITAKRGYYGETWKVTAKDKSYFIKLDYSPQHQIKYRNSLEVIQYLCDNKINFISRIIKTTAGDLYSVFNTAVLCVFEWIDGDNTETDETKKFEYKLLTKIYHLTKQGLAIPRIEFSDKAAIDFFEKCKNLGTQIPKTDAEDILATLEKRKDILKHYAIKLSHFAEICKNDESHFYITHGDAGGNLLLNKEGYHIVDWDEIMYAPLERDAWVMCCRDWAQKLFNNTLIQGGISYRLRPERLAFFCYHMFFWYLGELLSDLRLYGKRKEIDDYFNSWIIERMHYADTIIM